MRVTVCGLTQAKKIKPSQSKCLISIYTPTSTYLQPIKTTGWGGVLKLGFHDITKPYKGYVLFHSRMATNVIEFVNNNLNRQFIIHCDAGISRSAAIGLFLEDAYQANVVYLNNITPNKFVYNSLVHIMG